jgi:hypothetical protein
MAYERRSFSETAVDTQLSGTIDDSTDSFTIDDASGWPSGTGGKFYARIESETLLVTTNTAGTMTDVERGQNGTSPATHVAGVGVSHVACKADYDEANYVVSKTVGKVTAVGDLLYGDGVNSLEHLPKGTAGTFLKQGATIPAWSSLVAATDISDFAEATADAVGAMFTGNTETGISAAYDDTDNTIDLVVDTEFISDTVGAMVTGNTETGIAVTYDDADNTLDFVVGVDNSSVEINSGNIRVKASGITTAMLQTTTVTNAVVVDTLEIPSVTSSTWTFSLRQAGGSVAVTTNYAKYTRVGALVIGNFFVTLTANGGALGTQIDIGLPVNHVTATDMVIGGIRWSDGTANTRVGVLYTAGSDATRAIYDGSTLLTSPALLTGHSLSGTITYLVA